MYVIAMSQTDDQNPSFCSSPTAPPAATGPTWIARLFRRIAVTFWILSLLASLLWLYTRNNTFPAYFHPDEPGKVAQVLTGERNYRHPQLLLEATNLWIRIRPIDTNDRHAVVIAGREVSALFSAAAATMLALTAYLCAGWWGLILGSICCGLCPQILSHAHYMKEDAALLVGIALTLLASRVIWITRRWWSRIPAWILLAAGCALAISGKYVGAMALVLPLILFFVAPGFRWYRPFLRVLLFVPVCVACVAVLNHRALNQGGFDLAQVVQHPSEQWRTLFDPGFLRGLDYETEHSITNHWGLTAHQPNNYILRTTARETWPWGLLPAALLPLILVVTRKQGWGWETILILFTGICGLALSFSVILFPRYALPVVAMISLASTIAIARLLVAIKDRRVTQITAGACLAAILFAGLATICADFTSQFGHDSRTALEQWAVANLPLNARIYADGYTSLDDGSLSSRRPDVRLMAGGILPQNGSLRSMTRNGECYIAICDLSYGRLYETSSFPDTGYEDRTKRSKDFYDTLLNKQTPIWESVAQRPTETFANPAIRVYRLTADSLAK